MTTVRVSFSPCNRSSACPPMYDGVQKAIVFVFVSVLCCFVLVSPKVAVRVVADFTEYPHNYIPQTVQRAAEIVGVTKDGRYTGGAWDKLVSYRCV